ncbi:hypothetical protein ScPMuIL_014863 [Solemya velum]
MADTTVYPGQTTEAHPELFDIRAMPEQPPKKLGQLPENAIRQFFEEGYVVVEDFFTPEELDPCKTSINSLVDFLAEKLYRGGKIKNLYSEHGYEDRLTKLEEEFPGANVLLHKLGRLPQSFRNVWANERMLNVVEQLIGPNIAASPVWNLRTKTPTNEATTVPWHQDCCYFDQSNYKTMLITAWIPLIDATKETGCLEVGVKGHRTGRVANHLAVYKDTWYPVMAEGELEDTLEVKEQKVCPVPYGGILLFSNVLPHRSIPNTSNKVRWSLDLRWQRPDAEYGFFGLKEGVVLRDNKNTNLKPNWDVFDSLDRHLIQKRNISGVLEAPVDEFDTTIQGPWMTQWKIPHDNRHVIRHRQDKESRDVMTP